MSRLFWVILAVSLILTGLVAVDSAGWLSLWYAVPPLERFWPFLLTTLVYVILLVAAERYLGQRQSEPGFKGPAVTLLAMAMMSIVLQLAAMYVANPDPVSELFRRTVALGSGGYYNVAVTVDDLSGFLRQFPELMPTWDSHPKTHPPGLPLFFIAWRSLLERFPGMAHVLALPLRLDQCHNSALMFFSDAQLASAWLQMALPVLASAFLVWPVYWLGRAFYRPHVAWWAAAWISLSPSLIVFSSKWNQFYPLLLTCALLGCWYGLERTGILWFFASGLLVSIGTFLSFANLAFFAPLGLLLLITCYGQYRAGRLMPLNRLIPALLGLGVGIGTVWFGYWLYTGLTPLDIWRVTQEIHFSMEVPYWPWVLWYMLEFFMFGGFVLAGLSLTGGIGAAKWLLTQRSLGKEHYLALVFWGAFIALCLSGMSQKEVGRIWSFYLPLMTLTAAAALAKIEAPSGKFGLVTAALTVQLVIVVGFLRMTDSSLSDPPRVPPVQPVVDALPVDAFFEDVGYLEGYTANQAVVNGNTVAEIVLNWVSSDRVSRVYHVFVHIVDANGEIVAQSDDMPARLGYPTTCWHPGQRIGDPHLIVLPADVPSGDYSMQVGLYRLDTGERPTVLREGVPASNFVQVDDVVVVR